MKFRTFPLSDLTPGTPVDSLQWDARGRFRFWVGEDCYERAVTPGDPHSLALVRLFRADLPGGVQHGWPAFCRAVALPLVRSERPGRPLRRRERAFVSHWLSPAAGWAALWVQALGLFYWLVCGVAAAAWVGTAAAVIFAAGRWRASRRPPVRVEVDPDDRTLAEKVSEIVFAALGCVIGLTGTLFLADRVGVPFLLSLAIAFAPVLAVAFRFEGRKQARFAEVRAAFDADAAAEWDALHADPQREPAWQAALWDDRGAPGPARG